MSEKRPPDLREFWPWYERSTNINERAPHLHATPPPFQLGDISSTRADRRSWRRIRWALMLAAAACAGLVLYGMFR